MSHTSTPKISATFYNILSFMNVAFRLVSLHVFSHFMLSTFYRIYRTYEYLIYGCKNCRHLHEMVRLYKSNLTVKLGPLNSLFDYSNHNTYVTFTLPLVDAPIFHIFLSFSFAFIFEMFASFCMEIMQLKQNRKKKRNHKETIGSRMNEVTVELECLHTFVAVLFE